MTPRNGSAAKERLSRETVTASALALADAEGLDAVTIRRLAADHGVTPMALYWHFADKEALLGGVSELVLSQMELPADDPERPWDERLREVLAAFLEVLSAHPALVDEVKHRIMDSEAGLALTERVLGLLAEAGYDPEQAAMTAVYAAVSLVGLVTAEPRAHLGSEDPEEVEQRIRTKRATLGALSPGKYPHLVAAAGPLSDCESPVYFRQGLEVLVAGIRGSRRSAGSAS